MNNLFFPLLFGGVLKIKTPTSFSSITWGAFQKMEHPLSFFLYLLGCVIKNQHPLLFPMPIGGYFEKWNASWNMRSNFNPLPKQHKKKISHGRGALQLNLEKNWSKLLHEHETNPHYIIIIIITIS